MVMARGEVARVSAPAVVVFPAAVVPAPAPELVPARQPPACLDRPNRRSR
jgi:hypothetical protein